MTDLASSKEAEAEEFRTGWKSVTPAHAEEQNLNVAGRLGPVREPSEGEGAERLLLSGLRHRLGPRGDMVGWWGLVGALVWSR